MDYSNYPLPTARQFRAARSFIGLSQDELAKISGTSRRTVVSVEAGDAKVARETVLAIALALEGLDVTFFETSEMVGVKRDTPDLNHTLPKTQG